MQKVQRKIKVRDFFAKLAFLGGKIVRSVISAKKMNSSVKLLILLKRHLASETSKTCVCVWFDRNAIATSVDVCRLQMFEKDVA